MKVYFEKSSKILLVKFRNFEVNGTTKRLFQSKSNRWKISWNPIGKPTVRNIEGQMIDSRFIEFNYGKDNYGPFIGRLIVFDISKDRFSVRKDRIYDDGTLVKDIWGYVAERIKDR